MTPRKPAKKTACHIENSFEIVGRSVEAITRRLEMAELQVSALDEAVRRMSREIDRLKQPWWRKWL